MESGRRQSDETNAANHALSSRLTPVRLRPSFKHNRFMPRAATPRKPGRPRDPGADMPEGGQPMEQHPAESAPTEAAPPEATRARAETQSPAAAPPRQHKGRPPRKREPGEGAPKGGPIARAGDLQVPTRPVEPRDEESAPAP